MQIERAEFEFIDTTILPDWTVRIRVIGEEFEQIGTPIVAQVGSLAVQAIMPRLEGDGIQGFLESEPAVGDELSIGYADGPLIDTGITYTPPVIV